MNTRRLLTLCLLIWSIGSAACGAKLHEKLFPVALVGESYSESLKASDSDWELWGSNNFIFEQSDGDLPDGMYVTGDGQIVGTPTEPGEYRFKVTVFSLYQDPTQFDWEDNNGEDIDSDSQWFTFFATEPSSNANCPNPNDEGISEIYVCAGALAAETAATGDAVSLDVSYFVDLNDAYGYDVNELSFRVTYDADAFEVDSEKLNSQLLLESASHAEASVSFNDDTPGELTVTLFANDGQFFEKAGRLMSLPLVAKVDLAAETYNFTIDSFTGVSGADPKDKVELPQLIGIDGSLVVSSAIVAE